MIQTRPCVTGILVMALLYSTTPGAAGWLLAAEDSAKLSQVVTSTYQELHGKVLYPDGKTPANVVSVKVERVADKKIIHQTATNDKGAYKLPRLDPGKYRIIYGDRVAVNLLVVPDKEPVLKFLNVMIPRGVLLLTTGPLLGVVIALVAGGALAVVVVGVGGGFGGGGGGGGGPVSP